MDATLFFKQFLEQHNRAEELRKMRADRAKAPASEVSYEYLKHMCHESAVNDLVPKIGD